MQLVVEWSETQLFNVFARLFDLILARVVGFGGQKSVKVVWIAREQLRSRCDDDFGVNKILSELRLLRVVDLLPVVHALEAVPMLILASVLLEVVRSK